MKNINLYLVSFFLISFFLIIFVIKFLKFFGVWLLFFSKIISWFSCSRIIIGVVRWWDWILFIIVVVIFLFCFNWSFWFRWWLWRFFNYLFCNWCFLILFSMVWYSWWVWMGMLVSIITFYFKFWFGFLLFLV